MTDKKIVKNERATFNSKFRMEATRCGKGVSLVFSGIIGVEELNSENVLLKSHGAKIEIKGKRLNITVFENNDIEVVGKIEGIGFSYGKN